jgi:hypothetical protein
MPCYSPGCAKKYDFDHIAYYARKRYVDGVSTIALLCNAQTDDEKVLIVLASLPDFDDEGIRELRHYCSPECQCEMFRLRERLREMIKRELTRSMVYQLSRHVMSPGKRIKKAGTLTCAKNN